MVCETGVAACSRFDRVYPAGRRGQRSAFERLADSPPAHKAEATQQRLRGVLEAVSGESCFGEHVAFDIAGHGLHISVWHLWLAVLIQVVSPETLQGHVRSPGVLRAFEGGAQEHEVVKSFDDRYALEPLILERLDDTFRDSNGPVFPYGPQTGFDLPLSRLPMMPPAHVNAACGSGASARAAGAPPYHPVAVTLPATALNHPKTTRHKALSNPPVRQCRRPTGRDCTDGPRRWRRGSNARDCHALERR